MFKNKKYFFILIFLVLVSCKEKESVPQVNKDVLDFPDVQSDNNLIARMIDLQKDTVKPVQNSKMLDLSGFRATQSSTNYGAGAGFAIDGNTNSDFMENDILNSVTHTKTQHDPWWQVDLEISRPIDRIIVWNRTDDEVGHRLNNYVLEILDEYDSIVFSYGHRHNYKGVNTFVRDTISGINTFGRYVKIRLETHLRNRERLSIAEVQLFTFEPDKKTISNRTYTDSNGIDSQSKKSWVDSPVKLQNTNSKEDKRDNESIDKRNMNMIDLTGFKATQSSTSYGAGAGLAIDGNTYSDFMENDIFNSTTSTYLEKDPWWQVDLEKPTKIDQIIVWNRTDGGVGFRLNGYILEILDKSGEVVYSYQHKHNFSGADSFVRDTISGINTFGRYVKIRLETHLGNGERLSIAEVQLFTFEPDKKTISDYTYIDSSEIDLRRFKATQSSTNYGAGAGLAIDGNTYSDSIENDIFNSTTSTQHEEDPWWQVDLESPTKIDHIVIWNRTDDHAGFRLNSYILEILDNSNKVVYSYQHQHNYSGADSFVSDTISGVNTTGRFVRVRLETLGKKQRLSIAELQLFSN